MNRNKLNILIVSLIVLMACHSRMKPGYEETISHNDILSINGQCIFQPITGIDAELGSILCDDTALNYEYGRYTNEGPDTKESAFMKAFRGNYYAKFFEKIHIDGKLYKMFVDSVRLVQVLEAHEPKNSYLFECAVCDQVAILRFRQKIYHYPFFTGGKSESHWYEIQVDSVDGYYRKLYLATTDSLDSGLYLKKVAATKHDNALSIKVVTSKMDKVKLVRMLQSVRIIESKIGTKGK